MAKYIKQEMVDLGGKGEEKAYYRMQSEGNVGFKEFAQFVGKNNHVMSKALVENVLSCAMESMAELLGKGYSVTIDGLGTFKASIGLEEDKEMDTFDGDETKRNARSLHLNGVNFQADKKLVQNARRRCKLERAGVVRVNRSPYTKEERLQKALEYLEENKVLKVGQYMELTGLAHTTAANELRTFSRDASSGIVSVGRRPAVVYVKR